MNPLELDCNATLPAPAALRAALAEEMQRPWANPASAHAAGREAAARLRRTRLRVARAAGAEAERLLFCSSGSEANLLAMTGLPPAGSSLLISAIEHPSVLQARRLLERLGHRSELVPCEPSGRVDPERVLDRLPSDCGLVCLMSANNETGVLQEVAALGPALRERGVALHVDAVQSLGKQPLDLPGLGASSISLSGHKVGAPGGIGALVLADGVELRPLHGGSAQERGRRVGTHNLLGAIAWELALGLLPERWSAAARDHFEQLLSRELDGLEIHGACAPRLPNTSNLRVPGVDARALLRELDRRSVRASLGSACRSGSEQPSHVLRAMGIGAREVRSSLRFSFGPGASIEEAGDAAARVSEAVAAAAASRRDPA